jgi:hypothetical protein
MKTQASEPIFTRDTGIRFTKITFYPLRPSKRYFAEFSYWFERIGFNPKINMTIGGSTLAECQAKTEEFLMTELKEEEFTISAKNKPHEKK